LIVLMTEWSCTKSLKSILCSWGPHIYFSLANVLTNHSSLLESESTIFFSFSIWSWCSLVAFYNILRSSETDSLINESAHLPNAALNSHLNSSIMTIFASSSIMRSYGRFMPATFASFTRLITSGSCSSKFGSPPTMDNTRSNKSTLH
jgi:hypothetical protein